MKQRSSLKSLKTRKGCKIIKRGKKLFISSEIKKFKAKQ